jgi:formylglycine-generating enzyme required for sulfatase activity
MVEIFVISAAALLLEISYTRIISFKLYYYYTYLVIGLALLGLGSGAVIVAVSKRLDGLSTKALLAGCTLGSTAGVVIGYVAVAITPLDTLQIWTGSRSLQLAAIGQLLVIALGLYVSFLPIGMCVSTLFSRRPGDINRLYFSDLAGAALACLFVVPLIATIGPVSVIAVVAIMLRATGIHLADVSWRSAAGRVATVGAVVFAVVLAVVTRHFDAEALPVSIGSDARDDLVLADIQGTIRIGQLDGVMFVLPARGTLNVRVDGELLRGSKRIEDGQVISLDSARLTCHLRNGRLTLAIEAQVTAGDTAPPDFDALAKRQSSELTVSPVAFKPGQHSVDASGARRVSKTGIAVAMAFVVLAVLGWFAFTAKSVQFEISPAADSFELADTTLKFRIGDRFLLRQGSHRVVAELEGYYPIDEVIDVGVLSDQTFEFEFVRLPGLVSFRTDPEAGAEVSLNGEVIGTTPLDDFEIRPGTHQVQYVAERYLTEVATLVVEGGHARQSVTAGLTPSWAPIAVSSQPAGAEVLVDGRPIAVTPAVLELTAGERQIEFRLPGYNAWQQQVRVFADEPQTLDPVALSLADGRLVLATTPADATVYINGEHRGRTPVDLRLPPNTRYQVSVTRRGYQSIAEELTLQPGGRQSLNFELEPELGVVDVRTTPEQAPVYVGDQLAGVTPLQLDLMTIEQQVEIRLPGYAQVSQTITPRADYPQTLSFNLEMLDAETGDGYARIVTTGLGQRLRLIPAGRFQMGSSRADNDRRQNEVLHEVELSRAFYLAEREMTNAEFRHCVPDHDSGYFEGQSLDGDDQPVVNVRIQQVFACLNQLSIEDGLQPVYNDEDGILVPNRPLRSGYRLATEAEFAWAARAAGRGDAGPLRFSWGDELPPPDRVENLADLSAEDILPNTMVTYTDGFPVSAPVGSYAPNAAGLYDMGGNVSEWVQDYYDALAGSDGLLVTDPLGPERGRSSVIRGPSWRSVTVLRLRLSFRDYDNDARPDVGFRIARNLE